MNTLRQAAQEYLTMRRSLGYKLQAAGKSLLAFVTFMEQRRASYITQSLALAWTKQWSDVQPCEQARRLSCVRSFARHRSATDPRTQIPPAGLLPYRPKRAQPYLYSDEEIKELLRAALKLPAKHGLRPWSYHCLFGLLSVTGLRVSEAQNLELQDVTPCFSARAHPCVAPGRRRWCIFQAHVILCKLTGQLESRRLRVSPVFSNDIPG